MSRAPTPPSGDLPVRLRALAERLEREALPAALTRKLQRLLAEAEAPAEATPKGKQTPAAPAPENTAPPLHTRSPVQVWCDGSCAPNPGPGGWAALIEQDGARREISGAAPDSTNNIMEMTACLEALQRIPPGARVRVTTDSRYLMDGITRWLPGWKRKGWRKADGKPVLNQDLWRALDALIQEREVDWAWVAGHSGHPENERCDQLANEARRTLPR